MFKQLRQRCQKEKCRLRGFAERNYSCRSTLRQPEEAENDENLRKVRLQIRLDGGWLVGCKFFVDFFWVFLVFDDA